MVSKTRRAFLIDIVVVSTAGSLAACGEAPQLAELRETDVTAKAYSYRKVSTNALQNCANCRLKLDIQDPNYVACSIFPGRKVTALGWCSLWDAA
jgi:hypothetical protein